MFLWILIRVIFIYRQGNEIKAAMPDLKVSCIVPVYNDSELLWQCLGSVQRQSLKELEIICIDDGSTDDSAAVLQKYAERFPNITVVTQENLGAGPARNKGLALAKGEYILFLDADDYLLNTETLRHMVELADKNKANVVSANFKELRDGVLADSLCFGRYVTGQDSLLPQDYEIPWYFFRNIYKRKFLLENKINFPDYLRGQDAVFLAKVLSLVERIYIYPEYLYVYRLPDTERINNNRKRQDYVRHFIDVLSCLQDLKFYATVSRYERLLRPFLTKYIHCIPETCQNTLQLKYFEHLLKIKNT
jgi:glycosyltransferase involved in cell wall biosynthesis